MRKRTIVSTCLTAALTVCLLTGCGKNAPASPTETDHDGNTVTQMPSSQDDGTEISSENTEPGTLDTPSSDDNTSTELTFADIANLEFWFGSGAGGWFTVLTVDADGTFEGQYHDSEMGEVADDYPNGTMYLCNFTGTFENPQKINDYTYSVKIRQMNLENTPDTHEIIDGVNTIYAEPYGLENTDYVFIYLPGSPVSELPEDYMTWVWGAMDSSEEQLPFYGLYNEREQTGFSSYEVSSSAIDAELEQIQQEADALETRLLSELLTQIELNQTSYELYQLWDTELNSIWSRIKDTLDKDSMNRLIEEERAWIAYKDAEVKAAGEECAGGSMQALMENDRAAELTRARVFELAEYLR